MTALLCNRCGERIFPYVAYVLVPSASSFVPECHYHVSCWEELQRKAEDSNLSPVGP